MQPVVHVRMHKDIAEMPPRPYSNALAHAGFRAGWKTTAASQERRGGQRQLWLRQWQSRMLAKKFMDLELGV